MNNKKILAIVVTYNRVNLLKECINALKIIENQCDILVIDNHSTDDTPQYLNKKCVDNMRLEKNIGGAGGFSIGIKEAVHRGYDYLWIMDDDTIVEQNSLVELLAVAEHLEEFGFLCSYVKWKDETPCVMNIPKIERFVTYEDVQLARKGILKVKQASFVSMFISVSTVKQVGLPIKEFFIWGDDVEYSSRISEKLNSYLVLNSVVLHKMNTNIPTDIVTDDIDRIHRYKYLYRNQTYMARKRGFKAKIIHTGYICYQIMKIMNSDTQYKIKKIKVILSGWSKGIYFNPQIEYID